MTTKEFVKNQRMKNYLRGRNGCCMSVLVGIEVNVSLYAAFANFD